ncbi:MAG TPA: hypothetical protein VGK89_01165 [Candidatus Eisenbacteria bacterium]|jgi:hypothetical protein
MFVKRFFYACAGLLCLALAYHLGAGSATAQAPVALVGVTRNATSYAAVDEAGTVCVESPGGWIVADHIPGRPVSLSADLAVTGGLIVGTASGDIYVSSLDAWPPIFTFHSNVFGGTTSAAHATWGSVKARYRPEKHATPLNK